MIMCFCVVSMFTVPLFTKANIILKMDISSCRRVTYLNCFNLVKKCNNIHIVDMYYMHGQIMFCVICRILTIYNFVFKVFLSVQQQPEGALSYTLRQQQQR